MEWEDDHNEFGPCGDWKCNSRDCRPELYEDRKETEPEDGADSKSGTKNP
jgi:hypothetical protein